MRRVRLMLGCLPLAVLACGTGSKSATEQASDDASTEASTALGGATASGGASSRSGLPSTGGRTGDSGATASGGTEPEAGAPDAAVQACDSLPAKGTWERIGPLPSMPGHYPAVFAGGAAISVALDPLAIGTLYTGIVGAGIWRSTDCGATFMHVTTGRNAAKVESGASWTVLIDPTNSDVYSDSGYGGNGLFRSTNGGVDWDDITPSGPGIPSFINSFSMDPKDHKHLAVGFHENCSGAYAPMCFAETTDGAATWRFVVRPTKGWGEGAGIDILEGNTWIYGAPFDGLYFTRDAGATWAKVVDYPGCNSQHVLSGGSYYVGCLQSSVESIGADPTSLGAQRWSPVENSPGATALGLTGSYMYAGYQNDNSGQPIHRATLGSLTTWTTVATPQMKAGPSGNGIQYDSVHHILYVAAWGGGLWRVVSD